MIQCKSPKYDVVGLPPRPASSPAACGAAVVAEGDMTRKTCVGAA